VSTENLKGEYEARINSINKPNRSEIPLILAVDTSSHVGSLSLVRGPAVVCERELGGTLSHSVTLLATLDDVLKEAAVELSDVSMFAAASGPGSFTGLRIGLSTVKAFGATFARPCVGVPTMHALARSSGPSIATLVMLPAGRGEVFAQILSVSEEGIISELTRAVHLPPQRVIESLAQYRNLLITGAAAYENLDAVKSMAAGLNICTVENGGSFHQDAREESWNLLLHTKIVSSAVAAIAYNKYEARDFAMAEELDPIYVRASDPELKMLCPEANAF
jgi:tRNA threonylcarbamoyladenosine biosynthesis protein TsaB